MKEIGGYLELEQFNGEVLHNNAIGLNCGRNALLYIIKARAIKKIALPFFICNSVKDICSLYVDSVRYYNINCHFKPININLAHDEWIYIVNYYGQIPYLEQKNLIKNYPNIIIDNAQAYFEKPIKNIDTIYTCRKFFGVSDGAFLYTNKLMAEELETDISYKRMEFVLGRYEINATDFYSKSVENNKMFSKEPIKKMSKLTYNLLRGIDYNKVKTIRTSNYQYLFDKFKTINKLNLIEIEGAYMYPLMLDNAASIRKELLRKKIYIPILWPNVLVETERNSFEYILAHDILPIPCDQRYSEIEMSKIVNEIFSIIKNDGGLI